MAHIEGASDMAVRNRRRMTWRKSAVPRQRSAQDEFAAQVCSELAADLPDEDVAEDLSDCLDNYVLGSKPRCEEVEYLELVQEAMDRIARGR